MIVVLAPAAVDDLFRVLAEILRGGVGVDGAFPAAPASPFADKGEVWHLPYIYQNSWLLS